MNDAVLDAGPLIHLFELNALDVLCNLSTLYVPDSVWKEVSRHAPEALEFSGLSLQRVSVPHPTLELQVLVQALTLDIGEIKALSFMTIHPNALFLTDDAAARLAANQIGYQVHGTIGLLIRSVRCGARKPQDILGLLQALPESSTLFFRPSLLRDIVARLQKEWS